MSTASSPSATFELVEDLFRRESAHLVAALVRLFGPSNVALAEDAVHDALVTAMQAWRSGVPRDPKAWILQVAKNRAIDVLRRQRRLQGPDEALAGTVDLALSPEADAGNQLAMMFAICDKTLSAETHVTLILRLLCGFSAEEIARAFLVDVQTIDRRLHRGRARLRSLERVHDLTSADDVRARQPSVEQALYLLFNEGYHGSDPTNPIHPAMCADAIRLIEWLLEIAAVERPSAHALAALFCFDAARLVRRVDEEGVNVPLAEQDRSQWDQSLIGRGIVHLGSSAEGDEWTRWHLEAGIAFEHTRAASIETTDWQRIVGYYDALMEMTPGPVVALNRALAIMEHAGVDAGLQALAPWRDDERLARYSFFWAALADLERRSGDISKARDLYERAASLSESRAERVSYERRMAKLGN